jgi:hypothetical protein
MAIYELVLDRIAPERPADVVTDLASAEPGEVLFFEGSFWRVDAIKQARSPAADGRLVVSRTTGDPEPRAA